MQSYQHQRAPSSGGTYQPRYTLMLFSFLSLWLMSINAWAYSIQGTFVNIDGKGVAGVTVSAGNVTGSTDANGAFKLDGLAEGTYSVTATGSGYKTKTVTGLYVGDNMGQVTNMGSRTLVATTNSYRVKVGVMELPANTVAKDATVQIGSLTGTLQPDNYYHINLSDTSGTVTVSKPGYNTLSRPFNVNDDNPVYPIAWFYLVQGGYKVKGRILDIDKNPVAGVQLSLNTGNSAVSKADGTFEIADITNEVSGLTLTGKLTGYLDLIRNGYYVNNGVREYPAGDIYMIKAVDGFRVAGCVTYNGDKMPNVQVTVGDKTVRSDADGCYDVGFSNPGTYNYELKVVEEVPVEYVGQTVKLPATSFVPKRGTVTLSEQAPKAFPNSAYVSVISAAIQPATDSNTRQRRDSLGVNSDRLTKGGDIVYLVKIENTGDCPFIGNLRMESFPALPASLSFVAGQAGGLPVAHSTHPLNKAGGEGNNPSDYIWGIQTPLNCNLMDDAGGNSPYMRSSPLFPYTDGVPTSASAFVNSEVGGILKCETLGLLGPNPTLLPPGVSDLLRPILPPSTQVKVVVHGSGDGPPFLLGFKAEGRCLMDGSHVSGTAAPKRGVRGSGCQPIVAPPVTVMTPRVLPELNLTLASSSVTQVRLNDGNALTYNLQVSNDTKGQDVAKDATITISNVPSTLVSSYTADKGTCRKTTTGIQCLLQDLLNGTQANITLKLTPQQAPLSGSLAAQLTSQDTQDTPQTVALNYTVLPALTECEKNPTCNCNPKPAFCAGTPDLSIVFDDTGSMSEEIGGLRNATNAFINAIASQPTKPSIQLVSFKDNVSHRVTTDQMGTLQSYVNSLAASGGADCPENSSGAIDWVVNNTTANRLKDGGRILLVTDASPPHGVDLDAVIKNLVQRGIKVDVLISGDACVADGVSVSTVDAYSKIAAETHGYFAQVFEVNDGTAEGKKKYEDTARQVLFGAIFPTILGVDPNKAPQESTLNINLTAANTNFSDTSQVTFQKGDKTLPVNSVKVVSATQLVANVTLSDTVELGAYDVKVETKLGNFTETATATSMLEVTGPSLTPDIISVTPTSVMQNYTTEIELSGAGTHFVTGVSKLSFADDGIIVKELTVTGKTSIRATVEITTAAKLGMHPITVTTGNEVAKTPKDLFLVMQESMFAKLKEVTPHRGTQGGMVQVAITGSNTHFATDTSTLKFSGRGITSLSTQVLDETHLLATLLLDDTAPLGFRDVFVSTGDETAVLLNGLEVKPKGCNVIEGYVRSQDGQAVGSVYVSLDGQGVFTDATGYYRISGLLEGEYTVTATAKGYAFAPQTLYVGGQNGGDATCTNGVGEVANVTFQAASQLAVKIVAKDHFGECVKQDGQVTYDLITTNLGNQTATGVVLTNLLPEGVSVANLTGAICDVNAGTCQLPDLTPNAEAKVTVTLNNNQDRPLINRVMISSNEYPSATVQRWKCVAPYLSVSIKDTPDPIVMGGNLSYLMEVDLSQYAPTPATGVKLVTRLPNGVVFKSATTKYGTCDTSQLPSITCQLTDLSIAKPTDTSHVSVTIDVVLQDAGLLLLTTEATVSANEYPADTHRERTTIVIPPDVKVDLALVIDTTESMQEEINGVKRAIADFMAEVDASQSPTMVLVTFKDEVTVKAFTKDMQVLLGAVAALKAEDGGECPEASVEALQIAITHLKDGGSLLFSTDASPYADADVDGLSKLLKGKNMKFNALITGDCTTAESWNGLSQ